MRGKEKGGREGGRKGGREEGREREREEKNEIGEGRERGKLIYRSLLPITCRFQG